VVITNDAWFRDTQAPYEHFYTSIMRAVETRRPFVHVANTGISGFIDAKGQITGILHDKGGRELFISGGRTQPVFPQETQTLYVKYGKWLPLAAVLLFLLSLALAAPASKHYNTAQY
jgi:apolipoprotein N-acyltransferase